MSFLFSNYENISGDVKISGYKNSACPIIISTLIFKNEFIISNVPDISDIKNIIKIMRSIGSKIEYLNSNTLKINNSFLDLNNIDLDVFIELRASILFIGALLTRFDSIKIKNPGGCNIGVRGIKTHIDILKQLNYDIHYVDDIIVINKTNKTVDNRNNKCVYLHEFSVCATENAIMLGTLYNEYTIHFASNDPCVMDLCWFMKNIINIDGIGTNTIKISKNNFINSDIIKYTIMPDKIETCTFIALSALTSSHITLSETCIDFIQYELMLFKKFGVTYEFKQNAIQSNSNYITGTLSVHCNKIQTCEEFKIQDMVYPGLNPDCVPLFVILSLFGSHEITINDWMYENRFIFLKDLLDKKLLNIRHEKHYLYINPLQETIHERHIEEYVCTDLRGGISLLLLGIKLNKQCLFKNAKVIQRGYENIIFKLQNIGINIIDAIIQQDFNLKYYNTYRLNSTAQYFINVNTIDEFCRIIPFVKNYKIIGCGANLILNDYIKAVIIVLDLKEIKIISNNNIYVEAGVKLQELIDLSIDYSLDGLQHFTQIPGNVGGAIYMNIHYSNFLFSDFITDVTVYDVTRKKMIIMNKEDLQFTYYGSLIKNDNYIIVSCNLHLKTNDKHIIRSEEENICTYRVNKYPVFYTCGCVFHNFHFNETNTNIRSVGYYIDKWNLKNMFNNEFVKIYDKHCNMIITNDDSTCDHLITMIKNIQKQFIFNLGFDFCPSVECRLIGFNPYPLIEKKIHIIGIGGIGMSALGRIFIDKGFTVTGSDLHESEYTKGLNLLVGHDNKNIKPNQIIIYNDLIKENNVERIQAFTYNNLQLSRMETINLLLKNKTSIGITGCHGKTTTTSLLTYVLDKTNPSFLIGGIPKNYNTNGRYTNSSYIIFELDESNKKCETIDMDYLIMTNINNEHIENYGSTEKLQETFNNMANKVKDNLVYCGDRINKTDNLSLEFNFGKSYGFEEHNDYIIKNYEYHDTYSTFDICGKVEHKNIKVNLLGKHNVSNACGVYLQAINLNIPEEIIREQLITFKGVKYRLDYQGKLNGIPFYYDHGYVHSTAIKATLKIFSEKKILVVWHPPSNNERLINILNDCNELFNIECLIVTDMRYPTEINGKTLKSICSEIKTKNIIYVPLKDLNKTLYEHTLNHTYNAILNLGHPVSIQNHVDIINYLEV